MLSILDLALAFAAPAAQVPAPSSVILAEAGGNRLGLEHLETVLSDWARDGVIAGVPRRVTRPAFEACVADRRVDDACVRHSPEARGRVILFARDSGKRNFVLRITCVGPGGTGESEIDMNRSGALSPVPAVREQARRAIASCVRAAAPGVLRLPPA